MGVNNYVRHSGKINEPAVFFFFPFLHLFKLKYSNNKTTIRERLLLLSQVKNETFKIRLGKIISGQSLGTLN